MLVITNFSEWRDNMDECEYYREQIIILVNQITDIDYLRSIYYFVKKIVAD